MYTGHFIVNNSQQICTIRKPFAQMHFKTASFGEGTKKLWDHKITHMFTMGKWFDHSCFEYT